MFSDVGFNAQPSRLLDPQPVKTALAAIVDFRAHQRPLLKNKATMHRCQGAVLVKLTGKNLGERSSPGYLLVDTARGNNPMPGMILNLISNRLNPGIEADA